MFLSNIIFQFRRAAEKSLDDAPGEVPQELDQHDRVSILGEYKKNYSRQ